MIAERQPEFVPVELVRLEPVRAEIPFEIPHIVGGSDGYKNGWGRKPKLLDHGGDEIYVFSRQAFLGYREWLTRLCAQMMSNELGWSYDVSLRTMERGLKVTEQDLANESRLPSVLVFTRGGIIIGVSAQRRVDIYTRQSGDVPFLQHLLRAFVLEARGEHRGRFAVQQAQVMHPEAEYYGNASMSAAAMYANLMSGIFVEGGYYPLQAKYDTNLLAQEIMVGFFMRRRANGKAVDWSTGVSINDFPEPNKSFLPKPNHAPTVALYKRLQEEFGMVFSGTRPDLPDRLGTDSMNLVGILK